MLLVKLITPKKINGLYPKLAALKGILVAFFFLCIEIVSMAQDNSPYTRYGIGDLVPHSNINSRAMGGISAAYIDVFSVNLNNPASYSNFQAFKEPKSNKIVSGRAVLDIGVNVENRALREPGNPVSFNAKNLLFSHMQVAMPIRSNWGMSFGLRPVSRISYRIGQREILFDPNTGQRIDSAYTEYKGDGGSYLATVGTGFKLFQKKKGYLQTEGLALGFNFGYFFGKKDYSTRRSLINDTVEYYRGNYQTRTTFGNIYFDAGLQYRKMLTDYTDNGKQGKRTWLALGAYGTIGQKLNGKQDIIRETYFVDASNGNTQLDSVSLKEDIRGNIQMPSSFTVGIVYEKEVDMTKKKAGWLIGIDFTQQNWADYRFYGQPDFTQNKWEVRVGGQIQPAPKKNYFSQMTYRAGFFYGPDYINIQQELKRFGATFGVGLPIIGGGYRSNQATIVNLAFEFIRRGNNDNLLRENLFRLSAGFSLSDIWFQKRKYD